MKQSIFIFRILNYASLGILAAQLHAGTPAFQSELFSKGTLVYADDFVGEFNREWWQPRTKNWEVKDGLLIGAPDYKNAEEAQKTLGRWTNSTSV